MKMLKIVLILGILVSSAAFALTDSFFKMVSIGGPKSLDQAFVLMAQADTPETKKLVEAIGQSIVKAPRSFLRTLKKHDGDVKMVAMLVLPDPEGDQLPVTQKKEIDQRMDALRSIDDKELLSVRNRCLTALESKLSALNQKSTRATN